MPSSFSDTNDKTLKLLEFRGFLLSIVVLHDLIPHLTILSRDEVKTAFQGLVFPFGLIRKSIAISGDLEILDVCHLFIQHLVCLVRMRSPVQIWLAAPKELQLRRELEFFFVYEKNWRPHPMREARIQSRGR